MSTETVSVQNPNNRDVKTRVFTVDGRVLLSSEGHTTLLGAGNCRTFLQLGSPKIFACGAKFEFKTL